MVSLQYGFGIAASRTFVAVTLTEFFELCDDKVPTTGVPRSPPFAKVVGLGLPDFLGITLGPLITASYYFVAVALAVLAPGSTHTIFILCCPAFLVLGYLFLVLFPVLSACLEGV